MKGLGAGAARGDGSESQTITAVQPPPSTLPFKSLCLLQAPSSDVQHRGCWAALLRGRQSQGRAEEEGVLGVRDGHSRTRIVKSQGGTSCQVRLEEAHSCGEDAAAGATLCPPLHSGTHAHTGQGLSILPSSLASPL